MDPDLAVSSLRAALAQQGVVTDDADVRRVRGGYSTLGLAPSLLVWCGPEHYRWPSPLGRWVFFPHHEAAEAAEALASLLRGDPEVAVPRSLCRDLLVIPAGTPSPETFAELHP